MVLALAMLTIFGGMKLQAGRMEGVKVQQIVMMKNFIEILNNYMTVSEKWVTMLKKEDMAIYFAADSIAEIYKQKGEPLGAIPKLRALAEKKPVARKAILFKIKDIYKDAQKYNDALKVLEEIIDLPK